MAGKWDDLEQIAKRILNGENGGLFRQLVNGYKSYLYRIAYRWGWKTEPYETFQMLCNAGVDHGLKRWDGQTKLGFKIKNQFRKEYREAYKLKRITVDEEVSRQTRAIEDGRPMHLSCMKT